MRSLATTRANRVFRLTFLASPLALGALSSPAFAYCAYPTDTTEGSQPYTNVIATSGAGGGCSVDVTEASRSYTATTSPPGGGPGVTPIPYTGYAFLAYDGAEGGTITVSGNPVSITSARAALHVFR